jgi:hypothetical protein
MRKEIIMVYARTMATRKEEGTNITVIAAVLHAPSHTVEI